MFELLALFLLYFLPTLVAAHRGDTFGGVLLLNLLLGWTGVGWAALLLYALLRAPRYRMMPVMAADPRAAGQWQRF